MNSGGGGGSSMVGAAAGAGGVGGGGGMMRSPFTVQQWQELEHQALIYKYMIAGLPVPPDLVLPIQKSFESISARFFHHPTMGYCSFYGKKIDPEPGRCRRTDGKKWRCSKDAYPDSKYCERHMHRGRNRSRKPVESSQTMSQSSSSTVTSVTSGGAGGGGGNATFQNLQLQAYGNSLQGGSNSGTNQSHYNVDQIPYGIPSKDYRMGEQSLFSEASGSNRNLQLDSAWSMLPSRISSYPSPKSSSSTLQNNYPSFYGNDFTSTEPGKHGQSLRPFFDEWPKSRDSWSCLEEDRSNQTAYSTTQLSISIPMASSDFSASSSQSPHDN